MQTVKVIKILPDAILNSSNGTERLSRAGDGRRADYIVGATRIVCNPRVHVEEVSCEAFDPSFVIDLASDGEDG